MKSENKQNVRITVDIREGSASPAQRAAWKRLWTKLIADANHDLVRNNTTDTTKEAQSERRG